MTNKEKFIEVFGVIPDAEVSVLDCPPCGVECEWQDDLYGDCHCEDWWLREYKEPTTKQVQGRK